ncbi:ABC transporter [Actinomyces bowdenii]|uniref:ABC transporter n=1 Tax=Actinomyces bowdenii TaxID=131109 RepID=A0A853EIN2_9ACTO|nr:ABC transporter [Actinomyces bowdenii]MBF0696432.1 ABC transporter [Actinomyces bowdenii]NYS68605.1 ABC transporter [Actinomyces bowdenii]
MTAPTVPAVPAPGTASAANRERPSLVPYIVTELRNTVIRADTIIFIIIMPLAFYLMFGAMASYGDFDAGRGNVNAVVMVNMAVFSTAMAATSVAGTSAVELAGGWGRQMALTPGGMRSYILVKTAAAVLLSLVPVTLIFTAGALLGARCDSPLVWVGSYLLCLTPTIPFSLYGLAIGLWFPSQGAVGIASASVSVWGFLSNIFMPLSGTLFTIAHATPLYGAAGLSQRPILDDMVVTAAGPIREGMWLQLANLVAWTLILALICLVSRRRAMLHR